MSNFLNFEDIINDQSVVKMEAENEYVLDLKRPGRKVESNYMIRSGGISHIEFVEKIRSLKAPIVEE